MPRKKPSLALALVQGRDVIRQLTAQHRTSNPRVYGSVPRREDTAESDLDVLVPMPKTTLFDLGDLQEALEEALGIKVDVKRLMIFQNGSENACYAKPSRFSDSKHL